MSGSPSFAGQVPRLYDELMGPMFFEPYAAEWPPRLARLGSGALLETAAGTGIVTAMLAAALPASVAITATDISPAMLERAATRLAGTRVRLQQADAQQLPFADAAFDAVVCQFGMMFMPDKLVACREAFRVLAPGGRFLFAVWTGLERNPIPGLVQEAVAAQFPDDPPRFMARIPHGYHDIPAITAAMDAAGFTGVEAEYRELPCRSASSRDAARAICQGTPLAGEIAARGGPERLEAVTDHAARALAARLAGGDMDTPISAPMEAIFVSGRRPG